VHPALGCPNLFAPDGTACNDANLCTRVDACEAGACTGAEPVTCTSDDQCKLAFCNPSSGRAGSRASEGALCDDGGGCTTGERATPGRASGCPFVNPPGSPFPAGPLLRSGRRGPERDGRQDFVVGNPSSSKLICSPATAWAALRR